MRSGATFLVSTWLLTATVFVALASGDSASRAASFTPLGDLPGGPFRSFANAVSDNGSTVVGSSRIADFEDQGYVWTKANGMVALSDVSGGHFTKITDAKGISSDGSVIVGQGRNAGLSFEAFRWTQATGYVGLGDIPGGAFHSGAVDVSADGLVVAGTGAGASPTAPSQQRAFRWVGGVMTDLGTVSTTDTTTTYAISGDGQTVVGLTSNLTGFFWTQGTGLVEILPDASGNAPVPTSLSHNGSVVVGNIYSTTGVAGFRWTQATGYVLLGELEGGTAGSAGTAISADGSIVLGQSGATEGPAAFIWDATHGIRNLRELLIDEYDLGESLENWTLSLPTAISANGKFIVGNGINPRGVTEAFLVSLEECATPLAGDYNGDNVVDAADYTLWRDSLGQTGENLPADGSGNDEVDAEDYDLWKTRFGQPAGGGSAAATLTVPEPATWWLFAVSLLCRLSCRSRR